MNFNLKGTWEERNEARRAKAEKIYNKRKMEIVNTRSSHCDDYLIYDYVTIRTFNKMNEARFLTAIISRPNEYSGSSFKGVDVLIKVAERSQNDMLIGSITDEGVEDARRDIQNFLIQ